MAQTKCDKCCIGLECSCYEGYSPVDEGFTGFLEEEFSFCPHCGFELPEYVYKPPPRSHKPTDKVLNKLDSVIAAFYAPLIKEAFEPPFLSDLLDKHGVDSSAEDCRVKVSIHDSLREQREAGINSDDYEPTKRFQ